MDTKSYGPDSKTEAQLARSWRTEPATQAQLDGITRRLPAFDATVQARMAALAEAGLNKGEANELISWMDHHGAAHLGKIPTKTCPAAARRS